MITESKVDFKQCPVHDTDLGPCSVQDASLAALLNLPTLQEDRWHTVVQDRDLLGDKGILIIFHSNEAWERFSSSASAFSSSPFPPFPSSLATFFAHAMTPLSSGIQTSLRSFP